MTDSSFGRRGASVLTIVAVAVAGVLLGLLSVRVLFGGTAWVMVPWALACAVVGGISRSWRTAIARAAVFGFAVSMTFLLGGFRGGGSVVAALGLFVVLALFSAAIAALAALAVNRVVALIRRRA